MSYYRTPRTLEPFEEEALRAEADLLLGQDRLADALKILQLLKQKYPRPAWDALIREIEARIEGLKRS